MANKKNYSGFNPIIVATSTTQLEVVVTDVNNIDYTVILSRTLQGGAARYNLSGVVVEGFSDEEKILTLGGLTGYTTNKLFVKFSDSTGSGVSYAHNAVTQINKEDIFDADITRLLMLKDSYCVYDGFPFDLTVLNGSTYLGDFNNDFSWGIPIVGYEKDFFVEKSNDDSVVDITIGTASGQLTEHLGVIHATKNNIYPDELIATGEGIILKMKKCCLTDTPFYIRWINTIGGYEFNMFQLRIRAEQRVKSVLGVQTPIEQREVSQNTVISETINLSASNVVMVGQDNLNREEFEWLQTIALSPNICWYDEFASKWTNISLLDGNTQVWDTNNALGTIEYTFTMPRILTQF